MFVILSEAMDLHFGLAAELQIPRVARDDNW
jgi:hypothetical protein